jgi:hypothetical protein
MTDFNPGDRVKVVGYDEPDWEADARVDGLEGTVVNTTSFVNVYLDVAPPAFAGDLHWQFEPTELELV